VQVTTTAAVFQRLSAVVDALLEFVFGQIVPEKRDVPMSYLESLFLGMLSKLLSMPSTCADLYTDTAPALTKSCAAIGVNKLSSQLFEGLELYSPHGRFYSTHTFAALSSMTFHMRHCPLLKYDISLLLKRSDSPQNIVLTSTPSMNQFINFCNTCYTLVTFISHSWTPSLVPATPSVTQDHTAQTTIPVNNKLSLVYMN
jgi:hypothetical protein